MSDRVMTGVVLMAFTVVLVALVALLGPGVVLESSGAVSP